MLLRVPSSVPQVLWLGRRPPARAWGPVRPGGAWPPPTTASVCPSSPRSLAQEQPSPFIPGATLCMRERSQAPVCTPDGPCACVPASARPGSHGELCLGTCVSDQYLRSCSQSPVFVATQSPKCRFNGMTCPTGVLPGPRMASPARGSCWLPTARPLPSPAESPHDGQTPSQRFSLTSDREGNSTTRRLAGQSL